MNDVAATAAPLAGVRVLDLTRLLPGNYGTLLLAGLGADVIKVEDMAAGDGTRGAPPFAAGGSLAHAVLNRGKRSVQCDLKSADDRELFLALVSQAEVVVDSFRPGVLDRLGLGAQVLAAANPKLVHVSLTAYGTGQRAALAGHDLNAQALSGLLSLTEGAAGAPALNGVQIADLAAGLQVALAVVSGITVARRDGTGFRTNVAMVDAAYTLLGLAGAQAAATLLGASPEPAPRQALNGGLACYGVYECGDQRHLALGALEPQFFARFCELIGQPDLTALQYQLDKQDELRESIAAVLLTHTRDEWTSVLANEDTCVSPVNNVTEAFADADAVARGVMTDIAAPDDSSIAAVRIIPWLASSAAMSHVTPDLSGAPALGADSDVVRAAAQRGQWPGAA
jgi:crotonobetainyl-CoA:carnitine CoA-transferase CaiB-like acyl-CoA transferase